jgi:hypothetical protein
VIEYVSAFPLADVFSFREGVKAGLMNRGRLYKLTQLFKEMQYYFE